MSPLRGSLMEPHYALQRCHPYGVEEETGQKSEYTLRRKKHKMPSDVKCQKLYTPQATVNLTSISHYDRIRH